jgi:sugar/nucleoside kinase (ribokinase family)
VFGNTSEIQQVLNAFQVKDIPALYERVLEGTLRMVLVEDKLEGTVEVFSKDGTRDMYGPIKINKTGNSVGCCDGIAAGFLSLYQRGSEIDLCIQAGLVECAAIWEIETSHERLLDREELISRYASQFGDESRIEKALR